MVTDRLSSQSLSNQINCVPHKIGTFKSWLNAKLFNRNYIVSKVCGVLISKEEDLSYKRSHRKCSVKLAVLEKFTKCSRFDVSFSIKLLALGLRATTLSKERPQHRCSPVKFLNICQSTFFTDHLRNTSSGPKSVMDCTGRKRY